MHVRQEKHGKDSEMASHFKIVQHASTISNSQQKIQKKNDFEAQPHVGPPNKSFSPEKLGLLPAIAGILLWPT